MYHTMGGVHAFFPPDSSVLGQLLELWFLLDHSSTNRSSECGMSNHTLIH